MPVIELYLPDPEIVRRYFCGWLHHIWHRINARLFLHELESSESTTNSNSGFGRLLLFIIAAGLFSVDWTGHLRSLATLVFTHFQYQERKPLLSAFRDYSICWLNDVHFGSTMTSDRLMRECLFARYRLLTATRLTETASRLGVDLSVGSVHLVSQHPLHLFTPFVVDTRIAAFDARAIYIEQRVARLRDEVTVSVLTATQIVRSPAVSVFDILRHLGSTDGRQTSPLPSPTIRACAEADAETREMLRKEMEMCRQGRKFWNHGSEERPALSGQQPEQYGVTASSPISKAARHLCLQERLRIAAQ